MFFKNTGRAFKSLEMKIILIQALNSVTYCDIFLLSINCDFEGQSLLKVLLILDLLCNSNLEKLNLAIYYCFYLKLQYLLFMFCPLYFFGNTEKRIYDSNS